MSLFEVTELYNLISRGTANVVSRKHVRELRKAALSNAISGEGFTKMAFDTRRIDQETEYNPRRGLQNYHRSTPFIDEILEAKLANFSKLYKVLESLRLKYGREHEWQDSNARVLLSTLSKGLRIIEKDGDYAATQPSQGSLDYIEELLYVRYRLGFDNLKNMSGEELTKIILSKDEELMHKDITKFSDNMPVKNTAERVPEITKTDISNYNYDSLMEKLFGNVRASVDNPEVERTVTITIKDKVADKTADKVVDKLADKTKS